jgi:hypothetical protein
MDSKDAWKHTWSTLLATCSRLETGEASYSPVTALQQQHSSHPLTSSAAAVAHAEIGKHADSPLLKGVLDSSSPHTHTQVHRRVADARQQLVELQTLVGPVPSLQLSLLRRCPSPG